MVNEIDWSHMDKHFSGAGLSKSVVDEIITFARASVERDVNEMSSTYQNIINVLSKKSITNQGETPRDLREYYKVASVDKESAINLRKEIEELIHSTKPLAIIMALFVFKLCKRESVKCESLLQEMEVTIQLEDDHINPESYGLQPSSQVADNLKSSLDELTAILSASAYIVMGIQKSRHLANV